MSKSERCFKQIQESVTDYYSAKVIEFGASAKGVDWRDQSSQEARFQQLFAAMKTGEKCILDERLSILDYGCGYGALLKYLNCKSNRFDYSGFDWSPAMIGEAKKQHADQETAKFFSGEESLERVDFVVASGIFNVRLKAGDTDFRDYIVETLNKLDSLSKKGFAFNMLTAYSDKDKMREDLYYADPCFFLDYCLKHFSRTVSLMHGYGLYEFTIGVRKDDGALDICK